MVNGTDIETDDEMSNKPIAIPIGFASGLARATIFVNDALLDLSSSSGEDHGHKRERRLLRESAVFGFECDHRRGHWTDKTTGLRGGIRLGDVDGCFKLHSKRAVPKGWVQWIFCAPSRKAVPIESNIGSWSLDGPAALCTTQKTFILKTRA